MALPENVNHGTVTGKFTLPNGEPGAGSVTFTPRPARLINASADVVIPAAATKLTLDGNGAFTTSLIATDDPDLNPSDWTYAVSVAIDGAAAWSFDITVPSGSTQDLADIAPAVEPSAGTSPTVASVNGQTGVVVITAASLGAASETYADDAADAAAAAALASLGTMATEDSADYLAAAAAAALYVTRVQQINVQAGTTYTFVFADAGKLVISGHASPTTFTIPPNSAVAFPVGCFINVLAKGAGLLTIAPGAGVTLRATPSAVLRAQYSGATLVQIAADEWSLVGDLA